MTNDSNSPAPDSKPQLIPAVAGAAKDLRDAVVEEAHEVADLAGSQAKTLKEKVIDSGSEVRNWAAEGADQIKQAARHDAHAARAAVQAKVQETRRRVRSLEEDAVNYVRLNPVACVLGALGVGFLLGLSARR